MDIVSRTPFTLKLIQRFPGYKESVGSKFSMNERDIWENGFYTLAAEENETLEVYLIQQIKTQDYIWKHWMSCHMMIRTCLKMKRDGYIVPYHQKAFYYVPATAQQIH